MTRKNRFCKLQREQNSTNETTNASNETTNASKLDDDDERTKRNCTDPALILGHTVYLTLTL